VPHQIEKEYYYVILDIIIDSFVNALSRHHPNFCIVLRLQRRLTLIELLIDTSSKLKDLFALKFSIKFVINS
jgi:hypothetical protein